MKRKRILAMLLSVSMVLSATSYAMAVEIPEGGSYESVESDTRSVEMDNNGEIDEEVFEENSEDTNDENAENSGGEDTENSIEGGAENFGEENAEDSSKESAESSSEESAENFGEENTEDSSEESAENFGEENTEDSSEESAENFGEENTEDSSEESAENFGEENAEDSSEESAESSSEESAENSSEESPENSSEECVESSAAESAGASMENTSASSQGNATGSSSVSQIVCEECGEVGGHAENCSHYLMIETICSECGQVNGHTAECSMNTAVTMDLDDMTGCTGTFVSGAFVYASPSNASRSYQVKLEDFVSYSITIEEQIVNEDEEVWYRYSCDNLLANVFKKKYPYVKEEDVILDEVANSDFINIHYKTFDKETEEVSIEVYAPENAFPEGTVMEVSRETVELDEIWDVIENLGSDLDLDMEVLDIYAVDVSFFLDEEEQQPEETVSLRMKLPKETTPDNANLLAVLHIGDHGAELKGYTYLREDEEVHSIMVNVDGFSNYVAVYLNGKYNATLMRDVLEDDETYSIKTFPVTLFDYEPAEFNDAEEGNNFRFRGYSGESGSTKGINDSSSDYAKMGIVGNNLGSDGLPVINFSENVNGEDLFGTSQHAGKTVYEDVDFEFIYNNTTGYYEYKSAANHAQYNPEDDIVELYADTVSPLNNKTASIALAGYAAAATNDVQDIEVGEDGILRAVITETGENAGRLDPYIPYNNLDISASDTDKMVIKARLPEGMNQEYFKVYFTTDKEGKYDEDKWFQVGYTQTNGDWMEFVFDTTKHEKWTGKITGIRLDPFDISYSSGESYDFEVAEISFLTEKNDYFTRGGFYPFSSIQDSYPGNNDAFDYEEWQTLHENGNVLESVATRSIKNLVYGDSGKLGSDHLYLGMSAEFDFYLPVSRTASGEANVEGEEDNLRFEFNGDDDLWVFVDGQLVLDIGGGHGSINGYIDFTDGKAYVSKAKKVTGYDSAEENVGPVETVVSEKLLTPGRHTVKLFYMERCGSVSNCFIKFNLPQTPQAPVTVIKEVEAVEFDQTELAQKEFEFRIKVDGNDYGEQEYNLYGAGIDGTENRTTTVDGRFSLKDGQYAEFDIAENHNVYIEEISREIAGYSLLFTTVNDKEGTVGEDLTVANLPLIYEYVNSYKKMPTALTITKVIQDGKNPDQSFLFHVTGEKGTVIDVVIEAEQFVNGTASVTIKNVLWDDYKITEDVDWSWRYELVLEEDRTRNVTVDGEHTEPEVRFVNERRQWQWFDFETWCQNIFGQGGGMYTPESQRILEGE